MSHHSGDDCGAGAHPVYSVGPPNRTTASIVAAYERLRAFRPQDSHRPTCEYCGGPRQPRGEWLGKPLFTPCYCMFRLEPAAQ